MNPVDQERHDRHEIFRETIRRGILPADRARILREHAAAHANSIKPTGPKRTENERRVQIAREFGGMRRFMGTMKAFFRDTSR